MRDLREKGSEERRFIKIKRFTETNKWDDPWFVRLPWQLKLLWLYICDRCDASGVIDLCPEIASIQIGGEVTDQSLTQFGNRVQKLPNGKWQILKFLPFQYGTVDPNCPAHKPVIRLIKSNNLTYSLEKQEKIPDTLSNRVSDKVSDRAKEKEKDKESQYPIQITKYGYPLPPRCTIDRFGNVLDYTGRTMDINQVRRANPTKHD